MNPNTCVRSEITPVFGLTKGELWPVVEEAAGEAIASFKVCLEHQPPEPYGAAGEKEIPTFDYTTETGRAGRVTVFAKRHNRVGPAEAQQYWFLQAHQAPIPRLFGVLADSEGREILFLQYLDSSREARSAFRTDGLLDMLALMARFHAIQPSPEFSVWLEQRPWRFSDWLAGVEPTLERIWEHSRKGELGQDLQDFCSSSGHVLRQIKSVARQVLDQSMQMPQALIHSDFSTENTGRDEAGERLVMDVERIMFGPRFFDSAGLLGIPSERWFQRLSRKQLARYYLDEYSRWGGTPPPLDAFLKDMGILWLAGIVRYLDLNLNRAFGQSWGTTPTNEDAQLLCLTDIYRTLNMLLAQYLLRGTRCSVLER